MRRCGCYLGGGGGGKKKEVFTYRPRREFEMNAMISIILALVLSVAAGLVTLARRLNGWLLEPKLGAGQAPLPPGDMGWPLLGNYGAFLAAFKSGKPDAFIGAFIAKYQRRGLYRAHMFLQPSILATTPETVKAVLTDDKNFVPGWPKSTVELIGSKSFTSITAAEHARLRKLTAPALNGEALRLYLPKVEKYARDALEYCADQNQVSFLQEMRNFTFNVIVSIFLTYEPGPKTKAIEQEYSTLNKGVRALPINIPGTTYHYALKSRVRLVKLLQQAINERRRDGDPTTTAVSCKTDMLDILMSTKDENGPLEDQQIIDLMLMFLNAGHESSAHSTMWLLIFLLRNPDCYAKFKAEAQAIRSTKLPGARFQMEDFRKMKYFNKAFDEMLRIVNISPFIFRKALSDIQLDGFTIPRGWIVNVWLRQLHVDPMTYPDPYKFDPNRWDNFTPRLGMYAPFGMGSRFCPGNELARLEVAIAMHYLILDYKVEPLNPTFKMIYLPHPRPADNFPIKITRIYSSLNSS